MSSDRYSHRVSDCVYSLNLKDTQFDVVSNRIFVNNFLIKADCKIIILRYIDTDFYFGHMKQNRTGSGCRVENKIIEVNKFIGGHRLILILKKIKQ